jgi:hypothetical protein
MADLLVEYSVDSMVDWKVVEMVDSMVEYSAG